MCNASDFAIEVILGQRVDKKSHVIYYARHTLNYGQLNSVKERIFDCNL